MGRGGKRGDVTWEEVQSHNKHHDKWLVIEGQAYNITEWSKRHPGGSRVISHYAGQDATDAFRAFHNDLDNVKKYLKPIHVGSVTDTKHLELDKDFRNLRQTATDMGLFKPSFLFYAVMLGHVLAFEVMAYLTFYYFGTGWLPYIVSLLCASTMQVQAGWLQHDFGHLSVFKNTTLDHLIHYFVMGFTKAQVGWLQHDFGHLSVFKNSRWDHIFHYFTIGFIKGASPQWWNHMHYQHHAKPNVMNKDPDVRVEQLFVVGEVMPKKIAEKKEKSVPYNWQHRYFFLIGPPLLFPVYFQFMLFRHIFTRRLPLDFLVVAAYFAKFFYLYVPCLGIGGSIIYYFAIRCLESHWFTWVSQSNHIPMEIDVDKAEPWVRLQMKATCDIEKSFFNDWFTGHLNFQIEHHLFPTMPRHNLYKIAPLVKSLCRKHNIEYKVKTLGGAFADIVRSLKSSGELWEETYNAFHS